MLDGEPVADFVATLQSSPAQTGLDLAFDLRRAGLTAQAAELLEAFGDHVDPMVLYTLSALYLELGQTDAATATLVRAEASTDFGCFAFRLEELAALRRVLEHSPQSPMALYHLGCLLYDKSRYAEAITCWEQSVRWKPDYAPLWRNLAIARYSHTDRREEALPLLQEALALDPTNDQLVYETVLVMAKQGVAAEERLAFLESHAPKNALRDDIVIEWARALNQAAKPEAALDLLQHEFASCEGGEHAVAEQYLIALHQLGRRAMREEHYAAAIEFFQQAQQPLPENLRAGLWHKSLLIPHQYHEALCRRALGETEAANELFTYVSTLDIEYFSNMHLPELPVYRARALQQLGHQARSEKILRECLREWTRARAVRDAGFFSTTPFFQSAIDPAPQARAAHFDYLLGQARLALGETDAARELFAASQHNDPTKLYAWLEHSFLEAQGCHCVC